MKRDVHNLILATARKYVAVLDKDETEVLLDAVSAGYLDLDGNLTTKGEDYVAREEEWLKHG